jgi:hypothetical protein
MTNRWLQLVETHVEKGVLGLTGLFMVAMLWMYLIKSPNSVEYGGEQCGPRELMESVKRDADALDRAVRDAKADEPVVKDYSHELEQDHDRGIFAETPQAGPALTPTLARAASFGRPIVVPGLEDAEGDAAGSIVVEAPLRPSQPKLRTGRSLVVREQRQIAESGAPAVTTPEEPAKSEEVAWVSVAAYFNKKAQYDEMIKAGYAPYRSKAYVVGTEVQRQEVLSTGEYSDWDNVVAGKAMPKLELHEPQFDDQTGELINKDELRQDFALVKAAQPELMQPPFYDVEAGDFWEVPALAGHEDEAEDEEEEVAEEAEAPALAARGRTAGPPPPGATVGRSGRTGGGRSAARSSGRGVGRGGIGRSRGPVVGREAGTGGGGTTDARAEAEERRAARKQIGTDLNDAKRMLGRKEFDAARRLAQEIMHDTHATKGDLRKAQQIIKAAERWLEIQAERGGGTGGPVGRGAGGLTPLSGRRVSSVSQREAIELITNPATGEPAVWFHDDTVEAGKTYRYRMRVKLWNRYVGRTRSMKDPEAAKQPVVVGDWSFPSEPITVTPSTYFFVSGGRPADQSASVDVWKWRNGFWKKERFDVAVGDVIGGPSKIRTGEYDKDGDEVVAEVDFTTGAVVLDLRFTDPVEQRRRGKDGVFDYNEKTSIVMVYLDPADGQVKERALAFDRRDPKKKELEDEAW